jgi:hypothetical protein
MNSIGMRRKEDECKSQKGAPEKAPFGTDKGKPYE